MTEQNREKVIQEPSMSYCRVDVIRIGNVRVRVPSKLLKIINVLSWTLRSFSEKHYIEEQLKTSKLFLK